MPFFLLCWEHMLTFCSRYTLSILISQLLFNMTGSITYFEKSIGCMSESLGM